MRRIFAIFILLILTACGNDLIHDDFKSDLNQVMEVLDQAYEDNRELDSAEEQLLDTFDNKYLMGQFSTDDGNYEMSDIEKEIVRKISLMRMFTEHDEPLSSEETLYEMTKDEIEEYMQMKEIPEDLEDKHPTFEKQEETHPKFVEDTVEVLKLLEPMIETGNVSQSDITAINDYLEKYNDADGFEVDGIFYLHNDETKDATLVLWAINDDIDKGTLSSGTQIMYYDLIEELGID